MTTVRLIHSGICAFFGYSAFFAFVILKNYPSAVLGLIAGIFPFFTFIGILACVFYVEGLICFTDSILFFLHYLLRKRRLTEWYGQGDLRAICRYGILVATVGLLSLGYYTTIQIMYKKSIMPIPDSSVISIVWSFVALRSGLVLMYYTLKYQHIDEERLIDNREEVNEETTEQEEQEEPTV